MPIDPRIALGVQQSTFDPAAAMQNAFAIRNAQQTNQLNQMKLAAEQQAAQEAAGLQNYLTSANLSTPEGLSGLYRYGKAGATTATSIAERQKLEQEGASATALEQQRLAEYHLKRREVMDSISQSIAYDPSDANISYAAKQAHDSGLFHPSEIDEFTSHFLPLPYEQRKAAFGTAGMSGAQKSEAERRAAQTKNEEEQRRQEDSRIALERRRVQIAEAQNKRDQQTFDQEQSTAGKLGITKAAYQKLESAYPASTAANESANFAIDSQIADLKALRDHKGLSSIAGPFDAATKGIQVTEDTTAAQALFDKVASGQTIQNLIDLRRASPTGAGLSSISDKDVAMLKEGTGLNQRQYTPALKAQINSAIEKLENAKEVMNRQYTTTYSYKSSAPSTPAADDKAQTQKLEDPLGIRKSKAK